MAETTTPSTSVYTENPNVLRSKIVTLCLITLAMVSIGWACFQPVLEFTEDKFNGDQKATLNFALNGWSYELENCRVSVTGPNATNSSFAASVAKRNPCAIVETMRTNSLNGSSSEQGFTNDCDLKSRLDTIARSLGAGCLFVVFAFLTTICSLLFPKTMALLRNVSRLTVLFILSAMIALAVATIATISLSVEMSVDGGIASFVSVVFGGSDLNVNLCNQDWTRTHTPQCWYWVLGFVPAGGLLFFASITACASCVKQRGATGQYQQPLMVGQIPQGQQQQQPVAGYVQEEPVAAQCTSVEDGNVGYGAVSNYPSK